MNWKRLFKNRNNEHILLSLLKEIEAIRAHSAVLVLVPGTTGYNWMGVNRASVALFPSQSVVLPHYYSHSVFSESEQNRLLDSIQLLQFEQIIFSGFPAYFASWMQQLKQQTNQIALIYHGFFSELAGNSSQSALLYQIVELHKNGILDKIAFNKKGMAESLQSLWGITAHKIILKTPELSRIEQKEPGIHIGVLGNDQFRKNLHNQVVAASLVSNAVIHVTTDTSFPYLPPGRFVHHASGQSHSEFTNLLGSMRINLHVSYSESWGQLTTESLAMGVPCLVAYHSDVFDFDDELKRKLVVPDYDNSWAIYKQICEVLSDQSLPEKCIAYCEVLNIESEKSINRFLEA